MNAPLPCYVHDGLVSALAGIEREPSEGRRRLLAAMALYRNEDWQTRESAIEAYLDGRPSFWTSAGYSSQRASALVIDINNGASIAGALARYFPEASKHVYSPLGALDTLVPLNRLAASKLAEAYEAFGTWRDVDELEQRRVKDMRVRKAVA